MHSGPSHPLFTARAKGKGQGDPNLQSLHPSMLGSRKGFLEREGKAGLYIYSNSDKRANSEFISGLSIPFT